MENNYSITENNSKGLEITEAAQGFLKEISKWTKFLSIMGFIGIGFMVVAAILIGFLPVFSDAFNQTGRTPFPSGVFSMVYLVLAALYACPVYFLYQFSKNTGDALNAGDSGLLSEGFRYLKSHYKFTGIMVIAFMSIYALAIVVAIIVGVTAAVAS